MQFCSGSVYRLPSEGYTSLPWNAECRLLTSIVVEANQIDQLPDELGRVAALRSLVVYHNNLESLPDSLNQLRKLEYLGVDSNQKLTLLPDLSNVTSLLSLVLTNVNVCTFPRHSLPPSLQEIRLTSLPRLCDLPPVLLDLPQLRDVSISNCPALTSLSDAVLEALAPHVCELRIVKTSLRTLSRCIGVLSHLRVLCLSHNQLSSLPSSIGQLSQLRQLSVDSNRLTSLPASLSDLRSLERLFLDHNAIPSLPYRLLAPLPLYVLSLEFNPMLEGDSTARNILLDATGTPVPSLRDLALMHLLARLQPDADPTSAASAGHNDYDHDDDALSVLLAQHRGLLPQDILDDLAVPATVRACDLCGVLFAGPGLGYRCRTRFGYNNVVIRVSPACVLRQQCAGQLATVLQCGL